jgi:hypothetical protein
VLTIRHVESICPNSHFPGSLVEPPHLLWHPWRRPEILHIPVGWICKVNLAVSWVDGEVVERVELPAEEVVQDHYSRGLSPDIPQWSTAGMSRLTCGVVRSFRVHEPHRSSDTIPLALAKKQELVFVVGSPCC